MGTNQMGKTTTNVPRPEPAQVASAARISLARWLAAGRQIKNLSIEDIARVTKIPTRTLDRLEAGSHEGLPAEVFVKGFVRSFARAVGLDEQEALLRYSACGLNTASVPTAAARALVDSMAELAPMAAAKPAPTLRSQANPKRELPNVLGVAPALLGALPAEALDVAGVSTIASSVASSVESVVTARLSVPALEASAHVIEPLLATGSAAMPMVDVAALAVAVVADATVAKRGVEKKQARAPRKKKATKRELLAAQASIVVPDTVAVAAEFEVAAATSATLADADADAVVQQVMVADVSSGVAQAVPVALDPDGVAAIASVPHRIEVIVGHVGHELSKYDVAVDSDTVVSVVANQDVWVPKMPARSIPWTRPAMTAPMLPLVPTLVIDDADPESAERDLAADRDDAKAPRRSLIPAILLENDDRGRQGGLTLAVIILLIAATLTLSYLMRRPGAGGDGMTQQLSTPTTFVG
ncbi:MAG: helix-turn-helix domain-containing protein [Kofleriaceae bacterium]|nr:helix-turn-helix domain-containing protein [Kofleriaceae bacterium]